MRVVLDTNIIIVSLPSRSPYHQIFTSLVENKFELVVSNSILLEYQEIIQRKYSVRTANIFIELLGELQNVDFIDPPFKWNLITLDEDDNKFTDCSVAGYANFLVTEDRHFDILKTIEFPKIHTLSVDEFLSQLQEH